MEKGHQAREGERKRKRGTKGTGRGWDGAGESAQRKGERELNETGEMGRDWVEGGSGKGSGRKLARGLEARQEERT